MAALNFAYRYQLYDNLVCDLDRDPLSVAAKYRLFFYVISIYLFTLFAYSHILYASIFISIACVAGMVWFFIQTIALKGSARHQQLVATLLIFEAVVFFVIYNQMNSTLVLFAQSNSDSHLLGWVIEPAQYQILNPLLIILLGTQLPRFYQRFPRFSVPYQFACGTLLAGLALLSMAFAARFAHEGIVSGNYVALTYVLISLAELWVSAIGLSMIGLYCDAKSLGFAMGAWYLGCSLSNIFSGQLARWVAVPEGLQSPIESIDIYQHYYFHMGVVACGLGVIMFFVALYLHQQATQRELVLA